MTETVLRCRTSSEDATLQFGQTLGTLLIPGITVLLSGDLGTGKTALVRGIGNVLKAARVRSPSFTLVNEYPAVSFTLVHVDLYRLEPDEAEDLGLEDYFGGCEKHVLLVEWPERWGSRPKYDVLQITIKAESENERLFEVLSRGGKADAVFGKLREILENEHPFLPLIT
jgi:tRNA threonylcarbamoyladenosine biosynthesis protein TsaE